jgi:RNA 3'-terminal phosphate cyclase (ATP)
MMPAEAVPGLTTREPLLIDGAHGEGGGQILRTALALAAITGRPIHIERIRANRRNPGLAAQHLTAVRAVAAICDAQVVGDSLGSTNLDFVPTTLVAARNYLFDVGLAREGGSAGAIMLILQTVLLPLAFATGDSVVELHGGTHMAWSPPFDYVRDVWLPLLASLGIRASVELAAWGWYPVGKGLVRARIYGRGPRKAPLRCLDLRDRGALLHIRGRAVAANLPSHIPQRMADRALALLRPLGVDLTIEPLRVRAACPGAGLFLTADYANCSCGFSALGEVGKPSEQVAQEAVDELIRHNATGAALDRHLADQILLPLCFADGPSYFSVDQLTSHLRTNAWVIELFGLAEIAAGSTPSGTGEVSVAPAASPTVV